ncbi:MAG: cytidine deaminase [Candidatus Delongbacteria bacterium]|nr:cytidine deaminase [Candidatus Delongbacteria bacterium]MCG2759616.1 cytidine deaminase [Candidatus Delongbacteria bacterium]
MKISKDLFDKLHFAAVKARENSQSYYSKFKVGAAILTEAGKIYGGCNIESSSFGLTMCAERNALSNAICNGERIFTVILVTADIDTPISPCGACRQLLYDYAPGIIVIMTNLKKDAIVENIEILLKYPFGFMKNLK